MAKKTVKETIHAKGIDIRIYTKDFENEFISLTDIAKYRSDSPNDVIKNWMRNLDVIEFLGLWEAMHNPDFKPVEFDGFRQEAGHNVFTLGPQKWIRETNAIGIISKSGRYGGTYAHIDIAMAFATWISPEFQLLIMKDYRRLKSDENSKLSLSWNLNREISKLNYRIHTDAIKENLIPPELTPAQISFTYASEADLLNVALFGMTAKEWRDANPKSKGNIRDEATINQLLVLANMESLSLAVMSFVIAYATEAIILSSLGQHVSLGLFTTSFSLTGNTVVQSGIGFVLMCIVFNIINVIMEEGTFRGLFFQIIKTDHSAKAAVLIQALLFGIWHIVTPLHNWIDGDLNGAGFLGLSIGYIILAVMMGIKWGLMYRMTGSLYAGMADHFFNNCIATNLLHVITESGIDEMMIVRVLIAQVLSFIVIALVWQRKNSHGFE